MSTKNNTPTIAQNIGKGSLPLKQNRRTTKEIETNSKDLPAELATTDCLYSCNSDFAFGISGIND